MAIGIGTAIGIGSGLISGLFGLGQRRQARRLERNNIRPVYQENSLIRQNLAEAELMSRQGLPSQVYNNQLNQMNQGLSTGLRGLNRGRTTSYNVATILGGYNQGLMNLNAMDAQARVQNQRQLFGARREMAQEQARAFEINRMQPYQQTRQEVARLRGSGNQNIFGGISLLGQGVMMDYLNPPTTVGQGVSRNSSISSPQGVPMGIGGVSRGVTLPQNLMYRNYLG